MNKYQFCKILFSTLVICLLITTKSFSQCAITDLVVTVSDCYDDDKFSAEINFNFTETGANGFQILGNGNNYGTFQYADLPIVIENLSGNCEIEYEFIVRDVIDPTCAAFLDYGTVCCDDVCEIAIVDFEASECLEDGSFSILLNLEYGFVGDNGYSVTINGEDYGTYSYEELPLNIDNITSDIEELNSITVCDNEDPDCCDTKTFLNPCVCGITNITSEIVDCDITDSTYYVIINFDHAATNDSFQMGYSNSGTNEFLGTFAYTDLPVTAGPLVVSENEQEILIVDTENFFCFNSAYLGTVDDCNIECQLFNVFGEAYMCEEGVYFMDVEFDATDIEGSTFDISVDGINYGTFEYGENFYTVGPIPSNCDLAPTVVVQDSGQESCSDFYNLPEPICCLPDCNFTSFEATSECGTTGLTINGIFENNGVMLSSFYFVEILGTTYGPFPYGDFMFSLEIPLLPNGEYEVTINDSVDPECQISTFFIAQCDEEQCMIFDVFAEAGECEDNLFFVDVTFEYTGEVSDSFVIAGNGIIYGTFAYGAVFYTVGPLEGDCETIYEFFVSDQIMEGCNSVFEFEEPICCIECSIRDIEIVDYLCLDESNINGFTLDFIYENTPSDMFTLNIDGVELGSYFYSELPIEFLIDLPNIFSIQIQDSENSECNATQEIELDCSEIDCPIEEGFINIADCSDELGTYYLEVNISDNGSGQSVDVYINDTLSITIAYADLPALIGPLPIGEEIKININDSNIEECGVEFEVFVPMCETGLEDAPFDNTTIHQIQNSITVDNNEVEEITVQLFSTAGVLAGKMNINSNLSNSFDTSALPQGLYFLNISNGRSQKTVKVIIP